MGWIKIGLAVRSNYRINYPLRKRPHTDPIEWVRCGWASFGLHHPNHMKRTKSKAKIQFYGPEKQQQALELAKAGVSNLEITKELGLGKSTVADWKKSWKKKGLFPASAPAEPAAAPAPKIKQVRPAAAAPSPSGEVARLRAEIQELKADQEFLRKLIAPEMLKRIERLGR